MWGIKDACSYYALFKLRSKIKDVLSALKECYDELNDGSMNIGLCLEEVLNDENAKSCSDPKYNGCRKVYACAANKLGLLDIEGRVVPTVLLRYRTRVNDDTEFDKVYDACKSVEGTESEAVINTLRCILRTSSKARKKMHEVLPALKKM